MLSLTTKYALRIAGFLADHPGETIQGEQIAKATGIPANYLSKILNQLRKHGIVHSQKGWGGGFALQPSARSTPIAHIVALFDGAQAQRSCIFGLPRCDPDHPCPLHPHWERISKVYDKMLSSTTIADLRTGAKHPRWA